MSGVVVTDIARADPDVIAALGAHGTATAHEAQGRAGLLPHSIRPIQQGARIAGSAVTVQCWPGDNLMIHAAIEQCQAGDVLVVTTTSPSLDGAFGDLFATALKQRGVLGLVTTTGVRDTGDLREMGFPAWAAAVYAQGTVKATPGSVNTPIVVGTTLVRPGDIIIADDDGVVCVPQKRLGSVLDTADQRAAREAGDRAAYAAGELSLDRKGLRPTLAALGVQYMTQAAYQDGEH